MGIIQSDTNNPIIDAVLTDLGRKFIAQNDGSFSVTKFAAGDDEVDYALITQFGRTNGTAKIEKNTPVFEALTNQQFSQKFRLISVSNPNLIRLPNLQLNGEGVDTNSNIISIGNTTIKRRTITIFQNIVNETSIDTELRDQAFIVDMSDMFLQIVGYAADNKDNNLRATYILSRDNGETSVGGSKVSFTIGTKAISDEQFQIYGARYNKNLISTFMKVTGVQSGAVIELEVQINKAT
jgi:hypothetical protein